MSLRDPHIFGTGTQLSLMVKMAGELKKQTPRE
jgi:hypothetical protein